MHYSKRFLLLVLITTNVFAGESAEVTKGRKKCLKADNLNICRNALVGGSVTASSFALNSAAPAGTPAVAGIGGALGWATFYSQNSYSFPVFPASGSYPFSNIQQTPEGGISLNATNGQITVTNAGVYLISWTLAFPSSANAATGGLLYLAVNGTPLYASFMDLKIESSSGQTLPFSDTIIIGLSSGDVVTVTGSQGSGAATFTASNGSITLMRIA